MNTYDITTLPLPIKPGDHVFFVWDTGEIEEAVTDSVGIDVNGIVQIEVDDEWYEMGAEYQVFFTKEDAKSYKAHTFIDYPAIDYKSLNLPCYPGTDFFVCEYDLLDGWSIYDEHYTYVLFDQDGNVRVGDGDSECTVMGEETDACFTTIEQAARYVEAQREKYR